MKQYRLQARKRATTIILLGAAWKLTAAVAIAQTVDAEEQAPPDSALLFSPDANFLRAPADNHCPQFDVSVRSDYVASGSIKYDGGTWGNSGVFSESIFAQARVTLNDGSFDTFGFGFDNIWLNSTTGAPVPGEIHTLRLQDGLGYSFDERWTASISAGPVFYNVQDVRGKDLGLAGAAIAEYKFNEELRGILGVAFDPDAQYPVVPVGGIYWRIQPDLTLNLVMPKPRVIYRVFDSFGVFAGGEFRLVNFRTDEDLSHRTTVPGFDGAPASYRDFHLGGGMEYEILRKLFLTVEGGYSLGRQIKYLDSGDKVNFDSAPYVQGALNVRF